RRRAARDVSPCGTVPDSTPRRQPIQPVHGDRRRTALPGTRARRGKWPTLLCGHELDVFIEALAELASIGPCRIVSHHGRRPAFIHTTPAGPPGRTKARATSASGQMAG